MSTSRVPTFLLPLFGLALLACDSGRAQVEDPKPMQNAPSSSTARLSGSGHDLTPLAKERLAAIVKTLPPEVVEVTQRAGTERPNSSPLVHNKEKGVYVSAVGGLPLFRSEDKFESGTGWPSFVRSFDPAHVVEKSDASHGMERVELLDARSGAHLGHVFDDGPPPTGKRYCINGVALKFIPDGTPLPPESQPVKLEKAYFAGGCFWGVEDVFEQIPGVVDASSGYMGGTLANPGYKQVCSGTTGHAEAVEITFAPALVGYAELLKVFFDNHDATTMNRQGPDVGSQYRSAIFPATQEQRRQAEEMIRKLNASERYQKRPIVTAVEPTAVFYRAEEYHQDYHRKHGGSCKVNR